MKKVLLVDIHFSTDSTVIDAFKSDCIVLQTRIYEQARDFLKEHQIDLIIINIQEPSEEDTEFISFLQKYYKSITCLLITSNDINDYIEFAFEHNIYNILPKDSFFKSSLINIAARKILTKEIFGIEQYFSNIQEKNCGLDFDFFTIEENTIYYIKVKNKSETSQLCKKLLALYSKNTLKVCVCQVLEELTSNIYAHIKKKDNSYDYYLGYGIVDDNIILIVEDNHGGLEKNIILNRLKRNISVDRNTGLPESIDDCSGRGLYICREMSDHLIFNIDKNKKTQIIAIFSKFKQSSYKSLSIYEV